VEKNKDPKLVDDLVLDLLIPGMTNMRDRTLFTLFLATGLRISEMWQLDRNSISIAEVVENGGKHIEGSGKVLGKGRKIRTFFVDEETLVLYSEYLATRTDDNPALFYLSASNVCPSARFSTHCRPGVRGLTPGGAEMKTPNHCREYLPVAFAENNGAALNEIVVLVQSSPLLFAFSTRDQRKPRQLFIACSRSRSDSCGASARKNVHPIPLKTCATLRKRAF
jgi:hypothetical protein